MHGLAAVYLGFSIGFGRHVIGRMDAWFAYRFADGPAPQRRPRTGPRRIRHEWADWRRCLAAWAVAVSALLVIEAFSGWHWPTSMEQLWTDELWAWVARPSVVDLAWLAAGPVAAHLVHSRPVSDDFAPRSKEST